MDRRGLNGVVGPVAGRGSALRLEVVEAGLTTVIAGRGSPDTRMADRIGSEIERLTAGRNFSSGTQRYSEVRRELQPHWLVMARAESAPWAGDLV